MASPEDETVQHDMSEVPAWARPMVEDYLARKAAAERQEAEIARFAAEEAKLAERQAAKAAPMMSHMENGPGENFRRAEQPRVTAAVSTKEQRDLDAARQNRLKDARISERRGWGRPG